MTRQFGELAQRSAQLVMNYFDRMSKDAGTAPPPASNPTPAANGHATAAANAAAAAATAATPAPRT
jgi:hypothetical protein